MTDQNDTLAIARRINEMASVKLGFSIPDNEVQLMVRFAEARCLVPDEDQEAFNEWLIADMFARLSCDRRRQIVEELERDTVTYKKD